MRSQTVNKLIIIIIIIITRLLSALIKWRSIDQWCWAIVSEDLTKVPTQQLSQGRCYPTSSTLQGKHSTQAVTLLSSQVPMAAATNHIANTLHITKANPDDLDTTLDSWRR